MQRVSRLFSDEQKKRINDAVAEAESKTSAEIAPVVATASGRYDRPEDIVGLWLGAAAMVVVWLVFPQGRQEPDSWGGMPTWPKLITMLAALLVGFVFGAALASYVGWLRRLFTSRKQMSDEVAARARQVFFDNRVHHTAGGTGLCVYVSLYERMALLIADQAVVDKLGQDALDELSARLIENLRDGNVTDSICSIIEMTGDRLGPVLPRADDDVNELPDALVCLD